MTKAETVLKLALDEIGTVEQPAGSNRVKYNTWFYGRAVSGSAYPWCMAFVQWVYALAGAKLPYRTASCGGLLNWYRTYQKDCVVTEPRPGDIVIFDFPGGATTDHTGIFERMDGEFVCTVDGNTGDSSEANGGAVLRRRRHRRYVRAYIRPRELKEEDMSDKEIYEAVMRHAATIAVPKSVAGEFQEAIALGLTDGENPGKLVPAWRSAVMALRAYKAGIEHAEEAQKA